MQNLALVRSDLESSSTDMPDEERLAGYTLVEPLGEGGMASVHLAYTEGREWVAIKRIHRHLACDKHFVDMFLDEARIAASLRHPNVAQVFELGADAGEYFIAMEYLHGEHLAALATRLVRERGHVPFGIAAHIVARAAMGLHHAHEARGPDGEPLQIVHRDVSPQNIFVTYDGSVRITDFGVAKAKGRLAETAVGRVKGKLSYMAPEYALGQLADRRADVFALGIVLWELTTGRRLFKAKRAGQDLVKILSGDVACPTTLDAGFPPALERIVMRALAHRPEDRFATAEEMARELDRFVASRRAPVGGAELSALMRRTFGERIAERERLLRRMGSARRDPGLRLASPASDDELTQSEDSKTVADGELERTEVTEVVSVPAKWIWIAAVLIVGLLLGSGLGFSYARLSSRTPSAQAGTP